MNQGENMTNPYKFFFRFRRGLIQNDEGHPGPWRDLPLASKAVFTVIGCHCDGSGHAKPGQGHIGDRAGISRKTVQKGTTGLLALPEEEFTVSQRWTSTGRRAYSYDIKLPPADGRRKQWFPLRRWIVHEGYFSQLTPSAQALLPVVHFFAHYDLDTYDLEEVEARDERFEDLPFLILDAQVSAMAEHTGISRRAVYVGLSSLEEAGLIERPLYHGEVSKMPSWKVLREPPE